MKRVLLVAAAAASLAACSSLGMGRGDDMAMADTAAAPMEGAAMASSMSGRMMPTQAMAYIRAAGESDLFEITSSQVALQRTQNPEIRAFATTMVDHHTKTTNDLLTAAKAARIPPPPAVLGPQKRAMIEQLNSQTGTNFDRLYVQGQIAGHQEALGIHTSYSQRGDNPTLRAAAAATVPIVQGHLTQAQGLQARVSGGASGM